MKIITHPSNKEFLLEIFKEVNNTHDQGFMYIRPLNSIDVIFDSFMKPTTDSKTEFEAEEDKFCEYNTDKPSEWELFFGFIKPKKVPYFILYDDRKYTFSYYGNPVHFVNEELYR